jgi:capsular exopolysaccharide synthesis family protein
MDLSAYFRPLRRWWWLLVASTLLAIASSYLYVSQQPPLYTARTTLVIGGAFEDPNPTGSELALGQQLAETYADLAQRRPVREQTMAALGLKGLPEYSAYLLPNRPLLEIAVVDTDPQRAKAVANELARQLILQSPTAPRPEDQEREAFIDDQLSSLQVNIQETEAEIIAKGAELENTLGALDISRLQDEINALQTKLSTLQSNYAALLANTKSGAVNSIEVIEPATLPSAPTDSGKTQLILVAAALALALAAGTAYLIEYLDTTVRTPEDLARGNRFPSLASIPEFHWNGGSTPVLAPEAQGTLAGNVFRALRTGLYVATADLPGKIFLITSAAPKEGKSTVAANLATVLSQGDKSVLLIDADMHRPTQHKLFGISRGYGLADLLVALKEEGLSGGSAPAIDRAIQKIDPMGISLITAGSNLDGAAGLLGSKAMQTFLETVAKDIDYVLIDSPPLLAVVDALMLSTQVDGVVMVTSAGVIPRKRLDQALSRLNDVKANVVGMVLNRQKGALEEQYNYYSSYTNQA